MGAIAAFFAVALNFAIFSWQKTVFAKSMALARVVPLLSFLNPWLILGLLVAGAALGALGAWLTVRKINDGWSASQTQEA